MSQCEETWDDEVGCETPQPHRCKFDAGDHRTHRCTCGALSIEDNPALMGLARLAWQKTRWSG
jgi:hypothetical protein